MSAATYSAEEILAQLDACAREYTFPMLDNGYIYPADARLHLFRDARRWAIVIECLGYNPRTGGHVAIRNALHRFGNGLRGAPGLENEDFVSPTEDGQEGRTWEDGFGWYVGSQAQTLRIRDAVVPIPRDPAHYEARGIILEEPPNIQSFELLRALLPEHRHLLLATEDEIRRRLPDDLPHLLTLDEWRHPDVVAEEFPSQTEAFRMLADALVTGDPSHYRPTEPPNTHWSHWPEGGTL